MRCSGPLRSRVVDLTVTRAAQGVLDLMSGRGAQAGGRGANAPAVDGELTRCAITD
jgi:hypothetical protein